jgi:hypothetical protein
MSATTVTSSTAAASSLQPRRNSNSFDEVCHSRLHSLTSMSDELDAVSLPNIGNLTVNSANNSKTSSPSVSSEAARQNASTLIQPEMDASAYEDDPNIYMNLSAIDAKRHWDDIDRRPNPPTPLQGTTPIRILPSGLQEFKTPGGRTYFYNFDHDFGQWKPPRGNQMTLSLLKRQRTNDSFTSNEQDDSSNKNELSSTENIKQPQQITTFPVENTKQAFTSNSPTLGEASSSSFEEKHQQQHPSSSMTQSLILPIQQQNNAPMVNSVDSGLGRSSISYKNQAFGMKSIPDVMTESIIEGAETSTSKEGLDNFLFAQGNFAATAVKKGTLEKMKILDFGVKTKKKEWISAYAYLTSGHLLFYKDQKRAEKSGKHYPAPTDVCDLRGAQLSYVDSSKCKDKRRKHIVDLILPNNTEYWFSCNGNDIDSWYHSLRQTINSLVNFYCTLL